MQLPVAQISRCRQYSWSAGSKVGDSAASVAVQVVAGSEVEKEQEEGANRKWNGFSWFKLCWIKEVATVKRRIR